MKKRKKKKFWFRILLWILVPICILFILLTIFLRWFFPDEQVRQILENQLAASLNQPVAIQSIHLNPFGSIDFHDVEIGHPDQLRQGDMIIQVSQISVWYHLLPLLRKELVISGIVIDRPEVILSPPFQLKNDVSIQEDTQEFADSVKAVSPFPISLNLHSFRVHQIDFTLYQPDSSLSDFLHVRGFNFQVDQLELPKDFLINPQTIQGDIKIDTESSRFQFVSSENNWSFRPELKIHLANQSNANWELNSQIKIYSILNNDYYLSSDIDLHGKEFVEGIQVENINIGINGANLLQVKGDAQTILTQPQFNVIIESESVQLQEIFEAAKVFLPPQIISQFPNMHINGSIHAGKGFVQGDSKNAKYEYNLSLDQVDLLYLNPMMNVQDFNLILTSKGQLRLLKYITGSLSTESQLRSFSMALNDSTHIDINRFYLMLNSYADSSLYPQKINVEGSIQEILDGTLSYDFDLNRTDFDPVCKIPYQIKGHLLSDSLVLNQIPFLSEGFGGKLNMVLNLDYQSNQNAKLYLSAASDGLIYPFGSSQDTTPPLNLSSKFHIKGSDDFQDWILDSCSLQLNDLVKTKLAGSFHPNSFDWYMPYLKIDNQSAMRFIPNEIQKQILDLNFSGAEFITANGNGQIIEDSLHLDFNADLFLEKLRVDWPSMGLGIKEINGQVGIKGTPLSMEGKSQIDLNEIHFPSWRKNALSHLNFDLKYNIQIPAFIQFDEGQLVSDELGLNGEFDFKMANLDASPDWDGNVSIKIKNSNSIEIIDQLYLTGGFKSILKLTTLDQGKQQLRLTGNVGFDHLNLMQSMMKINDINGSFPLQFDYDLLNQRLMTPRNPMIYSWLDYELNRNFYKNRFPNLKTLRINSVETQGLQFKNFVLDIDVSDGLVQIPFFNVLLFGGNLGGSFKLDYGSTYLDSMTYSMKAQAAQINSAAFGLLDTKVTETSELNATMAFDGRGLDFTSGFDVNGYFYITKIGPRFASTLLKQMNPNGKDRSMTMTRRLLDTGWKPKRFSFDIRHSFVYPSLSLSQPWFSPVKIPGELQYGRLPIQLFLQSQTN